MPNFESQHKLILEPFVLAAMRPDGNLFFENSFFSELSKLSCFLYFRDQRVLPATKEAILKECEAVLKSGVNAELFEMFSEQDRKWYSCKAVIIREQETVDALIISYFDVTERKMREEAYEQSEKMLLHAQHIAHVGTWQLDAETKELKWSDENYITHGVDKETYKVTLDSTLENIHKEDREHFKKTIENAIKNKTGFDIDKRIFRPDGTMRYLHTWGIPLLDISGKLLKLIGVCQDVSEFKMSQESLEQTLSLFRATIESTADGILVVNEAGKIITFNRKFIELWRMPESIIDLRDDSKAIDYVLSQLLHPEKFLAKVQELYKDPWAESYDTLEFIDERVFERYSKPQIINDKPVGRVWSFRDVTTRVHAERDAQAASIAKTQFLANISHEIRTPLTAVLGFSDLLADSSMKASERLDLVSRVQIQGANLLRIVDDILDLSKIEFGHFHIKESKVNILELVRELKQIFSFKLKERKTQLIFSTLGPVPKQILSDPIRLKQILMNLIGNSIKFTWSGTVEVQLRFFEGKENHPAQLAFRIRDNGIGMDMEQAKKLFEPFVQIDSSLTRKFSGTGLGLALSKDLATALGGTVRLVDSKPGSGSTFEATVNPGDVSDVGLITDVNAVEETEMFAENSDHSKLANVKILVVEDSVDNQFIISQYLKKAGATQVDCSANGEDGVKRAVAGNYDIVFMDLQMPVMNGYEATKALREQGYAKPIIALTAHAMNEEVQRCMDAGCNYHLSKPIDRNKIIATAYHYSHQTH